MIRFKDNTFMVWPRKYNGHIRLWFCVISSRNIIRNSRLYSNPAITLIFIHFHVFTPYKMSIHDIARSINHAITLDFYQILAFTPKNMSNNAITLSPAAHEIAAGHRSLSGTISYVSGTKEEACKWYYSAWNSRRSSVTVRYDFMCDRQDSFSAGHNDRQVFKFQ